MKLKMVYTVIVFSVVLFLPGCSFSKANKETAMNSAKEQTVKAVSEWRELKYGMFIHFGMSTYTGHEIDSGNQPSTIYAPTNLDVDQWVRVARDAGMKYVVLTSKHVSGHCLWDSKVMWKGSEYDYDVATSSNKTDVIAEFVAACKKYDIKPGLYWCMLDFRNNSVPHQEQWFVGKLPDDFYQFTQDQLAELMNCYPEIKYYWIDIPRAASMEQRTVIYNQIKEKEPDCVVLYNHGIFQEQELDEPITIASFQVAWPTDILDTECWLAKPGLFEPKQEWQGESYLLGYEHCDKIGKSWFWEKGDEPRSTSELYQLYKRTAEENDGNLLLNVPPDRTGRIEDKYIQALMELKKVI